MKTCKLCGWRCEKQMRYCKSCWAELTAKKMSTDCSDCHGLNPCESVKSVDKMKGGEA